MSIPRDEQETVLVFNNQNKEWDVYSCVPKHIRRIMELTEEVEVLDSESNRPIAIRGKLNEKQVSMRKQRKMSEEQRKKAAERLAKARKSI